MKRIILDTYCIDLKKRSFYFPSFLYFTIAGMDFFTHNHKIKMYPMLTITTKTNERDVIIL